MKRTLIYGLLAILSMLLLGSCAGQRALTGPVDAVSARIDAQVKALRLDETAGGNIKMKRGEAIQLSLTKFGIEGVRVVFTPDSILFLNKLSKTYLRTSFRDADRALTGGDGTLNFANVEAYFWNDGQKGSDDAVLPVGGMFPVELHTSYGRSLRVGEHRLPLRITMELSAADGAVEAGSVKLKLSKVKAADHWTPNTQVPSKYRSLNAVKLLRGLLGKAASK